MRQHIYYPTEYQGYAVSQNPGLCQICGPAQIRNRLQPAEGSCAGKLVRYTSNEKFVNGISLKFEWIENHMNMLNEMTSSAALDSIIIS